MEQYCGVLKLISASKAADMMGLSTQTLTKWRKLAIGPPWQRVGKRTIRYDTTEIERWIKEQNGNHQNAS